MSSNDSIPGIKILVPEMENVAAEAEDDTEELGVRSFVKRWVFKDKELPIGQARQELQRVEAEVDQLLAAIQTGTKASGFHLKTVEVAVGLSASGSIGVVTAGVQASLTLVYDRSAGSAASTD